MGPNEVVQSIGQEAAIRGHPLWRNASRWPASGGNLRTPRVNPRAYGGRHWRDPGTGPWVGGDGPNGGVVGLLRT
jgi:hypothetical protein